MGPSEDQANLAVGTERPSNASWDSPIIDTNGFGAGWVELLIPNGSDLVCTVDIMGGLFNDAAKLGQLPLDASMIYCGLTATLLSAGVTGLTHGGAGNPGRISVAADLAADTRIKIPTINWPRFLMVRVTRASGGSAGAYWEGRWFGRKSS